MCRFVFVSVWAFAVLVSQNLSASTDEPIIVGQRVTLKSQVLGEDREIMISTPRDYDAGRARYPVLYVMDGAGDFYHAMGIVRNNGNYQMMPRMIVVGIPNTDRNRDLTPTHTKLGGDGEERDNFGTTGGADQMLKFIRDELFPYVEGHYRTLPFRVLSGHSFGGLFATHAFLSQPDMFNAFISISGSMWWDDEVLLKRAEELFKEISYDRRFFHFSVGGEEHERQVAGNQQLYRLLREADPKGLTWHFSYMIGENHGSLGLPALDDGLRFIFSDWAVPPNIFDLGLEGLKAHFAKVSQLYGVEVGVPENSVNQMGYRLLGQGEVDQAIAVFRFNVETYPESANVYDSLGEAYEQKGELKKALELYERAVSMGEKIDDPNLGAFQIHVTQVKEKMKEMDEE